MKAFLKASIAVAVVWVVYILRGNIYFRLYPAVMSALALSAFAVSSFRTPLVEIVARRRGEILDSRAVAYCRKVNNCWTAFLAVHFAVTVGTVFMSHEVWVFYNGFFAYVLFALMFAGEWLVRRKMKGHA